MAATPQDAEDTSARNKAIALAIWGRDLNGREDPSGAEFAEHFNEFYTSDYWNHASEPGKDRGIENARAVRKAFKELFTDANFEVDMSAADGDLVFLQGMFSAKHTGGTLFGIPASGLDVRQAQVHTLRFRDGKVSDHYVVRDDYAMYRQVAGVHPEGGILRFVDTEQRGTNRT